MSFFIRLHIIVALFVVLSSSLHAGVRINEFLAAPWERQVTWDTANGQPRIGAQGPTWHEETYDSSHWLSGTAPFGFGVGSVTTDLSADVLNKTPSLYVRKTFSVSSAQAARSDELQLRIDYDDGFVAYLNGTEIARGNTGPPQGITFHDQPSFNERFGSGTTTISLGAASGLLQTGNNILCVQVHNHTISDGDFLFEASLVIDGAPATDLITTASTWDYLPGVVEPSGGHYDSTAISSGSAEAPEWVDWIELYNDEATPQPLLGWSVTDDKDLPQKWVFPDVILPAHGFLIVYADGLDAGLHTNFKLGEDGEYLALFDASQTLAHEVAPGKYPNQHNNISYAIPPASNTFAYATSPTPGEANAGEFVSGKANKPKTSPDPGIYDSAVTVVLTTKTEGAEIRYTLDGTEPTTQSSLYSGPLTLPASGTSLRARAFKAGLLPSSIATGTYLINLPAALTQLPIIALSGNEPRTFYAPHGIFTINGGTYNSGPYIGNWYATGPEDYNVPINRGVYWERLASLEILKPDTLDYVQKNLGCRLAASNHTRNKIILDRLDEDPWPPTDSRHKPSMNFYFRDEYAGKLNFDLFDSPVDSFERLRCRAGKNDIKNPFILDELIRRIFIDMGQVGARGLFANLFLNGHYKGYYNLTERPREPFMQNWFNSDEDWDILHIYEWASGDPTALYAMFSYLENNDLNVEANYEAASKLVDMENFADYLALNVYTATADWPGNNYTIARERTTDTENGKFRFFVWDAEGGFNAANIGNAYTTDMFTKSLATGGGWIARTYQALQPSKHFRLLFADRLQKHFFNDGALTVNRMEPRFLEMQQMMDPVMQHVIGQSFKGSFFYDWTNNRGSYFFDDCRQQQLWPVTSAPQFNQYGGPVATGFAVDIINPNTSGSIYYTLDGTDPRAMDESAQGTLYQGPIALQQTTTVKARVWSGSEWSPLIEADFVIASDAHLIITEIMYDPPGDPARGVDGGEFEFIELRNVGTQVVELDGFAFTAGIQFAFDSSHTIPAGGFLVLAQNPAEFSNRYSAVSCAGQYTGKLSNGGEKISLSGRDGEEFLSFTYDNSAPWPVGLDETGHSLVAVTQDALFDHTDPDHWMAGSLSNGTPGSAESTPVSAAVLVNEVLAHTDLPQVDTVELYNPESVPADISYWYLTDDPDQPKKFQIPPGTIMDPKGVVLFDESDFNPDPGVFPSFAISSLGDKVYLFSGNSSGELTGYQDHAEIDASKNGEGWSRIVLSTGEPIFLPGAANSLGFGTNTDPRVGPVIISELLFAPTGGNVEFIELRNISDTTVHFSDPLIPENTWRIDGIDFTFPENTFLEPGEIMIVAAYDPDLFKQNNQLASSFKVFGPYSGVLQKNGETIRLSSPDTPEDDGLGGTFTPWLYEDKVKYENDAPWPAISAASGLSLERIRTDLCGMDPAAWAASTQPGGTPGALNENKWDLWRRSYFAPEQLLDEAISGENADPDHDGYSNLMEFALAGNPDQPDANLIQLEFVTVNEVDYPALRYTSFASFNATILVETSTNLFNWAPDLQAHAAPVSHNDGTITYLLRDTTAVSATPARFLRLKVSKP